MNLILLFTGLILILLLSLSAFSGYSGFYKTTLTNRTFFLLFLFFALINKLPNVSNNNSLNSDEAINLAVGQSLHYDDPVLWRTADFTTLGPLHTLSFGIPGYFGFAIDYSNSRIIWLIIILLTYFFIFKACRVFFGPRLAQLSFLYPGLFFAFGNLASLNHFYNEATSILVLSIGLYLFSLRYTGKKNERSLDYLFYFLMGITPYFKLQAIPIAFFLCMAYYIRGFQREGFNFRSSLSALFFGLLPTFLLLGYLAAFGQIGNFYSFYILMNSGYGDSDRITGKIFNTFLVRNLNELPISYFLKAPFLLATVLMTLLLTVKRKDALLLFITGLSWITIYAVAKPGYAYSHYFTYLILPLPLVIGYFLNLPALEPRLKRLKIPFLAVLFLFCFSLSFFNLRDSYYTGLYRGIVFKMVNFKRSKVEPGPLAQELLRLKLQFPAISRLVNFDWYPEIHIETGILQGTHINVPERLYGYQVSDSLSTGFSRKIFLKDLQKNKPEIILIPTTTQRSYFDFTYTGFHRIPEIKAYVDQNYSFYRNVDNVDILLRNDLKSALPK